MAMIWRVRVVRLSEVDDEVGVGTWEPFATFYDTEEDEYMLLLRGLFEIEGDKSSTKEGNQPQWGYPQPDVD